MEITKKIEVLIKDVFGVKRIYPNNLTGTILLELTGKKSFSEADINCIKRLGYTVEVVAPEIGAK